MEALAHSPSARAPARSVTMLRILQGQQRLLDEGAIKSLEIGEGVLKRMPNFRISRLKLETAGYTIDSVLFLLQPIAKGESPQFVIREGGVHWENQRIINTGIVDAMQERGKTLESLSWAVESITAQSARIILAPYNARNGRFLTDTIGAGIEINFQGRLISFEPIFVNPSFS